MSENTASQGRTSSRDSLWLYIVEKKDMAVMPTTHWWHTSPQLEDAIISPFCIGDPEAQDYPRETIIHERTPLPGLTVAFTNPSILRGTGAELIRQHSRFNFAPATVGTDPCHAILVLTKVNKALIGLAVVGAILISMAVGAAVGFASSSAEIGFGAAGLAIAVLIFTQAYLATA